VVRTVASVGVALDVGHDVGELESARRASTYQFGFCFSVSTLTFVAPEVVHCPLPTGCVQVDVPSVAVSVKVRGVSLVKEKLDPYPLQS